MMSPRLPLDLITRARRARHMRTPAIVATVIAVATAATPVAASAADAGAGSDGADRSASRAWSPFFEQLRPVPVVDARRVVVTFEDDSLGERLADADLPALAPSQRRAWLAKAEKVQQKRIEALAAAGVQFTVRHRYLRVVNGVSVVVHGDGAQLLRDVDGVAQVTSVRTVWPTGSTTSGAKRAGAAAVADAAAAADGAEGAAAVAGAEPVGDGDGDGGVQVAVLDTGIDASHRAVAGRVADAFDATVAEPPAQALVPDASAAAKADAAAAAKVQPDAHGTAVAGTVLRAAGDDADVTVVPVQVLTRRPARDGVEAVLGTSDDLLAGLEHVVDPDGDGDTSDALDAAVIASTTPFAGFSGSPEDHAVQAADALGTVVVAAAGNDGASGDEVGTIGSFAASTGALSVGAVDLRDRTPAADVRVRGGGIDDTFAGAAVLTSLDASALPAEELPVVVVSGRGDEVVDYLDSELRSRVAGAAVLVAARDGVTVAAQVRAAADAGARVVLVSARGAGRAAGTIDAEGADIPAIAIRRSDARALRDALVAGEQLGVTLTATTEENPGHGRVAGFSSAGPRLDGAGRPDALAPGVGMVVAGEHGSWHIASGTSIAAGWAGGEVAALRSAHPDWTPAAVRAALLGSAIALGESGDRPAVSSQGAGVLDAARAAELSWRAGSGRIDFGTIAPGGEARRALDLQHLDGAVADLGAGEPKILLDDGGRSNGVTPALDGRDVVLAAGDDARTGHVGGWLVLPDLGIRIPWTATIRDPAAEHVAIEAELTNAKLAPVAGPGAFASTLSLAIGGSGAQHDVDALGLGAVERLEVRLVDASGKDHGSVGGLDQVLPGIYSFGITGQDPAGKQLAAGVWQLQVRYVPATDPSGGWRDGPAVSVVVPKPAAKVL